VVPQLAAEVELLVSHHRSSILLSPLLSHHSSHHSLLLTCCKAELAEAAAAEERRKEEASKGEERQEANAGALREAPVVLIIEGFPQPQTSWLSSNTAPDLNGRYLAIEHLAGGRVVRNGLHVWKKEGGKYFLYCAQRKKEEDQRWHWWISDEEDMQVGKPTGYAKAASEATQPHKIDGTWEKRGGGGWESVDGARVLTEDEDAGVQDPAASYLLKRAQQGNIAAQFKLARLYYDGKDSLGVPKDYKKAAEWYEKAAEQGLDKAQHLIALMYCYGKGVPKDYKKAAEWYEKAAEQGLVEAQYNFANLYHEGKGVPKNATKAVEWLEKAAAQGCAPAVKFLSSLKLNVPIASSSLSIDQQINIAPISDPSPPSPPSSSSSSLTAPPAPPSSALPSRLHGLPLQHPLLQPAHPPPDGHRATEPAGKPTLRFAPGDAVLACMRNEWGEEWKHGTVKSLWYTKTTGQDPQWAAAIGSEVPYLIQLADGANVVVPMDSDRLVVSSILELQQVAARDHRRMFVGSDGAIACTYRSPSSSSSSEENGAAWHKKKDAAPRLNVGAADFEPSAPPCAMDQVNDRIRSFYKPTDQVTIFEVSRPARGIDQELLALAQQGDKQAQFDLACVYYHVKDSRGNCDFERAAKLFEIVAEQGHVEAQYSLGIMYYKGEGVPKAQGGPGGLLNGARGDATKAAEWLGKAAAQGCALAIEFLSVFKLNIDQKLVALAQQGNKQAQFELACVYYLAKGVPKDNEKAAEWYEKAAEQGHVESQYNLGVIYCCAQGVPKDDKKAAEWLETAGKKGREWLGKAAEQGNLPAIKLLSSLPDHVQGVVPGLAVVKEVDQELLALAQQGDKQAQFDVGHMYHIDKRVKRDFIKAVEWYEKAAQQGHDKAQYMLAGMYVRGGHVPEDKKRAAELYEKAAEHGHPEAQYSIASMHYSGSGVPKDYKKAAPWFEKAAEQGHVEAQYNFGCMHHYNQGVPKDLKKAAEWYQKAAAQGFAPASSALYALSDAGSAAEAEQKALALAQQGDKQAQFDLADMYYYGKGVPIDHKKAARWYEKVAKQGYSEAQYNLGVMYYYAQGVPKDDKKAAEWNGKAAAQGLPSAMAAVAVLADGRQEVVPQLAAEVDQKLLALAQEGDKQAQYDLACVYYQCKDVPKEAKRAFEWYEYAAEQGCAEDGHAEAQSMLAYMYYHGEGVPKDTKKAAGWYKKVAAQGHVVAQYTLAEMYFNGDGVPKDYKKATEWFEKAAEQGHAEAQYKIAGMYYHAKGVPKDWKKAAEWQEKAAENGSTTRHNTTKAQLGLAHMYYRGEGVPQDATRAAEWYKKAAAQGNVEAQYKLADMYFKGEGLPKNAEKAAKWWEQVYTMHYALYTIHYTLIHYALYTGGSRVASRDKLPRSTNLQACTPKVRACRRTWRRQRSCGQRRQNRDIPRHSTRLHKSMGPEVRACRRMRRSQWSGVQLRPHRDTPRHSIRLHTCIIAGRAWRRIYRRPSLL
jgi:TPR repeat protein